MTHKELIERVIQHPVTSHALLELLIEDGVRVSVDPKALTFEQRKVVLRKIVDELYRRNQTDIDSEIKQDEYLSFLDRKEKEFPDV